jgi:hypothetical protein
MSTVSEYDQKGPLAGLVDAGSDDEVGPMTAPTIGVTDGRQPGRARQKFGDKL